MVAVEFAISAKEARGGGFAPCARAGFQSQNWSGDAMTRAPPIVPLQPFSFKTPRMYPFNLITW